MKDDCRCVDGYYNNKPHIKLQTATTHKTTFVAHNIEKAPTYAAPKVVQKHYDPSVLQTSYKSTYVQPPPSNDRGNDANVISQYMANKPKNVPFYSETEYKKSFQKTDMKVEKQPAFEYKPKLTKFEGQSSYKAEFVEKKNPEILTKNDPAVFQEYLAKKPKISFQGSSSYKDTFKDHGVRAEKQPQYKYEPKKTKFQGESSYKSTFKELPREVYKGDAEYCPVHPSKVAIK